MSLAKDTAVSAVSTVISTGSRLVVTVMLARRLAPSSYGEFIFAQWIIDLLFMICSMGLPASLTRFLPAISASPHWTSLPISRRIFALVVGSFLISVLLFSLYVLFGASWGPVESLSLIFWCSAYLAVAYIAPALQGLFRYDAVMAGSITFAIVAPVLIFVFLKSPSVPHAALAMGLAWLLNGAAAAGAIVLLPSSPTRPPSMEPVNQRSIAIYAGNLWVTGLIAGLVWTRGELGVLKFHVDSAHIGIYAAGLTLVGLVSQGAALITGALTPHLVTHWHARNDQMLAYIVRGISQLVLIVTTIGALFLIGVGETVIPMLLGNRYAHSYEILAILSLSAISISSGCANTLLQIESNGKFGLFVNTAALIILVIVSVALTPIIGIVGAAIARSIAQTIVAFVTFQRLRRIEILGNTARKLTIAFSISLGGIFLFYLISSYGSLNPVEKSMAAAFFAIGLTAAIRAIVGAPLLVFARLKWLGEARSGD